MSIHTLFVCEACGSPSHDENVVENTEGNQLLQQLLSLQQQGNQQSEFKIQPAGCLWTCSRACCASFLCDRKFIYHFVDLPVTETAMALLEFNQLYMESEDGYVLPANFPKLLKSRLLVRIPPVPQTEGAV